MKKLFFAVLALGFLALGFALVLLVLPSTKGDETASGVAQPENGAQTEEVELDSAAPPSDEGLASPIDGMPVDAVRAVVETASAPREIGVWGDVERRLVRGRITLPAGVPADPTLQVVALSKNLDVDDIYGNWGVLSKLSRTNAGIDAEAEDRVARLEEDEDRESRSDKDGPTLTALIEAVPEEAFEEAPEADGDLPVEDEPEPTTGGTHGVIETIPGLLAIAPVQADGSFELPFPEGSPCGWVAVDGRYLFTMATTAVDFESDAALAIEPDVGAWVTGSVEIPRDIVNPSEVYSEMRVTLEYDPTQFSFFDLQAEWFFDRVAILDQAGRFEFRGVDSRPPYKMEVASSHLANVTVDNLELGDGRDRHVHISLLHGGRVLGRVLDEEGDPVAEATIRAGTGSFFGFATNSIARGETDEDGWFELPHVSAGDIQLRVSKDGYLDSRPFSLNLEDQETRDGVLLELGSGNRVAGVVLHPNGTPASGVSVDLDFDPDAMASMAAFNAARGADGEAETDESGHFLITGLGKGPFLVVAEGEFDGVGHAARVSAVSPGNENLSLILQPDPRLLGTVMTGSGEPVIAFSVRVESDGVAFWMGGGATQHEFEDLDGQFEIKALRAGDWKVMASADGLADSGWTPIQLPLAEGLPPLQIVLEPEALASGAVLNPEGSPIAGATVRRQLDMMATIASATGKVDVAEARTDEDGFFELGGLSTGTVSLVASHPDFVESDAFPVDVLTGVTTEDIVLQLRIGGTLTGEVFDEEGEPAGGVMLFMQDISNFMPVMMKTEPDGTFRRENIKPATWQVRAMLGGDVAGSLLDEQEPDLASFLSGMRMAVAEIKDGEVTHVVLGAPPTDPVTLKGVVTHADEPVAKALVSMFPEGAKGFGELKFTQTSTEGTFEFVLDHPGQYLVQVQLTDSASMGQDTLEFPQAIPDDVEEHEIAIELPTGRLSGQITGPDGKPASAARVSLCVDGGVNYGSFMGARYVESMTDEDGQFDIQFLHPGTYSVAAGGTIAGGFFGGRSEEGREIRAGVRVEEGEWVKDLEFRLKHPGEVAGQVIDVTGAPVSGAAIFVRDESGSVLERFSFITTDASGRFRYSGVAPGRYTVSSRTSDLASFESDPVNVTEGAVSETTIRLDAGTMLLISVVDQKGGLVHAKISVRDPSGHQVNGLLALTEIMNAATNLYNTKAQRVGPLPAARYTVTATAEDGRTVTKPVTLSGQAERKLKIRLK